MLFATLAALSLAASDCGVRGARSIVDFDILHPPTKAIRLPQRMTLTFEDFGGPEGYSAVVRGKPSDYNLLHWAPRGPESSDLFAWSHVQKYFPDVRHLPLKDHRGEVVVDLRRVRSISDPSTGEAFTGGTVHLCWLDNAQTAAAASLLEELNDSVESLMPEASEEERARIAYYQDHVVDCPSDTSEPEGVSGGIRLRSGMNLLVKTIMLDDTRFCLFLSSPAKRPLSVAEARQVEALTVLPNLEFLQNNE